MTVDGTHIQVASLRRQMGYSRLARIDGEGRTRERHDCRREGGGGGAADGTVVVSDGQSYELTVSEA